MGSGFEYRFLMLLKERQLTLSQLAEEVGVSRQTPYNWIKQGKVSSRYVARLADHLGVDRLWLAEGVGTRHGDVDRDRYDLKARELIHEVVTSEKRLRLATHASKLAIWEYDLITGQLQWPMDSGGGYEIDFPSAFPDLDSLFAAIPEDEQGPFKTLLDAHLQEERSDYLEIPIEISAEHRRDGYGGARDLGVWLSTWKDAVGRPKGVVGAIQDITSRKQQEQELLHSKENYRFLFETAPVGIGIADMEGCVKACNPHMAEIFGFDSVEELSNRKVGELYVYPEQRESLVSTMRAQGSVKDWEVELYKRDGSTFHALVNSHLTRYEDQPAVFTTLRDISQWKEAEESIRRSHAVLKSISKAAERFLRTADWEQEIGSVLGALGEAAEVSRVFLYENHTGDDGLSQASLKYEWDAPGVTSFHGEEGDSSLSWQLFDLEGWEQRLKQGEVIEALAEECSAGMRAFFDASNTVSIVLSPVLLHGRLWGFIGFDQCCKEHAWCEPEVEALRIAASILGGAIQQKMTVQALRQREFEAHAILNAPSDVMLLIAVDGTLLRANASLAERFGKRMDELIGSSVFEFFPPEVAKTRRERFDEVIRTGEPVSFEDERAGRFYDNRLYPLFDDHGEVDRLAVYARDITAERKATHALKHSEDKFRRLIENLHDNYFFYSHDIDGKFKYVSPSVTDILGYSISEYLIHYQEVLTDNPVNESVVLHTELCIQGYRQEPYEVEVHHKTDGTRWLEVSESPVFDEHGQVIAVEGIARDITEDKKTESELLLAASVFEGGSEAITITDPDGVILKVNRAYTEITGYSAEEAVGNTPRLIRSDRHDQSFYESMWASLAAEGCWQSEIWNRRKNGEVFPAWLNITAIRNMSGEVEHYVASFSDISKQKLTEEHIKHLAHYDVLTGLPNRLLFTERCSHALEHARRVGHRLAVLILDLDNFKNINDGLGYPSGDEVLVEIGARIKSVTREDDTVARLGGDEFAVLLESVADDQSILHVIEKIMSSFDRPYVTGEQTLQLSVSMGVSLYPENGTDANMLVRNADAALYRAKERGRNIFCFYTSEMTWAAVERVQMESSLKTALDQNQFELYYQPKFSPKQGKIVGAEALIRWHHPEQGMVMPDKFIPIIERSGLIIPIGHWVLREACAKAARWKRLGLLEQQVAVNVAGPQMLRSDLLETVKAVLEETGLDPSALELEITETFIMQQAENTIELLKELRAMGVSLAIDDFGTGYSSLAYLKQLPIDRLKIDRTFVTNILNDPDNRAIATAVIALGHNLGLKVTAEGIEEEDQARFLYALNCTEGQGFLYSPPVPADEFEKLLKG
ncbi:MAG: EAL domain-containing protein [Sedimenticola sp.]